MTPGLVEQRQLNNKCSLGTYVIPVRPSLSESSMFAPALSKARQASSLPKEAKLYLLS